MNDYLSQIYAAPTDIDPQLATAGELLAKIAEEEGVDLDSYSDGEINDMLSTMMEDGGAAGGVSDGAPAGGAPEGGEPSPEKVSEDLTVADVSAELSKQAALQGVDLTKLSREEFHEAYNYVHATLTDPEVAKEKVAMEEKVAEADMLGRVMAHSFDDELKKVAELKPWQSGSAPNVPVGSPKAPGKGSALLGKAKDMGTAAYKAMKDNPKTTAAAAGGAALATGGALLARNAMKKRKAEKAEGEEKAAALVVERAREIATQNGYDPDTGEKVASDLDTAALNLLRENGYEI